MQERNEEDLADENSVHIQQQCSDSLCKKIDSKYAFFTRIWHFLWLTFMSLMSTKYLESLHRDNSLSCFPMRTCISIKGSVSLSVRPSIGPSVYLLRVFQKSAKRLFLTADDIRMNGAISRFLTCTHTHTKLRHLKSSAEMPIMSDRKRDKIQSDTYTHPFLILHIKVLFRLTR